MKAAGFQNMAGANHINVYKILGVKGSAKIKFYLFFFNQKTEKETFANYRYFLNVHVKINM